MEFRKTKVWLAITGWLPWSCLFGIHDVRLICRGHVLRAQPPGSAIPMGAPTPYVSIPFVFVPRGCVCKRCGEAW